MFYKYFPIKEVFFISLEQTAIIPIALSLEMVGTHRISDSEKAVLLRTGWN